jgi:hypothetical protein
MIACACDVKTMISMINEYKIKVDKLEYGISHGINSLVISENVEGLLYLMTISDKYTGYLNIIKAICAYEVKGLLEKLNITYQVGSILDDVIDMMCLKNQSDDLLWLDSQVNFMMKNKQAFKLRKVLHRSKSELFSIKLLSSPSVPIKKLLYDMLYRAYANRNYSLIHVLIHRFKKLIPLLNFNRYKVLKNGTNQGCYKCLLSELMLFEYEEGVNSIGTYNLLKSIENGSNNVNFLKHLFCHYTFNIGFNEWVCDRYKHQLTTDIIHLLVEKLTFISDMRITNWFSSFMRDYNYVDDALYTLKKMLSNDPTNLIIIDSIATMKSHKGD